MSDKLKGKGSTISAADFGEFVGRVLEDQNLPARTRSYLIALVHEQRMQSAEGRSRLRSRGLDIGGGSDIWRDAAWLGNPELDEQGAWRLAKSVIGDDAPRYEMPRRSFDDRSCIGTMLRPLGAPCRKRATISSSIPNPFTGERRHGGACSNPAHRALYEAEHKAGWAAWKANGEPKPANNTGGHLRRYLTYSAWDQLYAWANYRYTPGETPKPIPERSRLAIVTPLGQPKSEITAAPPAETSN